MCLSKVHVNLSGFVIIGNEHPTLWKIMGMIPTRENKITICICTQYGASNMTGNVDNSHKLYRQ